ncbi:hypothetical protein Bca52824_027708 [Brassica carinata]|uniref:Uncharacterized protein n=1 Tax=Brassica carinata TaxID=52824 RepID=A0A8X8ALP8_BRACI|nr:hypothetical protein Bca52824_027708 [Brassica carinata]
MGSLASLQSFLSMRRWCVEASSSITVVSCSFELHCHGTLSSTVKVAAFQPIFKVWFPTSSFLPLELQQLCGEEDVSFGVVPVTRQCRLLDLDPAFMVVLRFAL